MHLFEYLNRPRLENIIKESAKVKRETVERSLLLYLRSRVLNFFFNHITLVCLFLLSTGVPLTNNFDFIINNQNIFFYDSLAFFFVMSIGQVKHTIHVYIMCDGGGGTLYDKGNSPSLNCLNNTSNVVSSNTK